MISIQVNAELAQRKLSRVAALFLGERRAVNKGLAAKLFELVMDNFEAEAHEGEPWTPLAPATVRFKERHGYEKILQNTGALRQSFLPFSDNEVAGVGAKSYVGRGTSRDAPRDVAKRHEQGISVPARPMLPSRRLALSEALVIYNHFLARLTK